MLDRIETLASVVDALPLPGLIVGQSKRILVMNKAAIALLGLDARGGHYTSVLRQPAVTRAVDQTLVDGDAREARVALREGAGSSAWKIDMRPLGGSASAGCLLVFQDLSGAEGLGQMRRDFVANVSHELRTPLTAITGFIETLRGPARGDEDASKQFLGMMATEAERMNTLVRDLLSLSRVESQERLRPEARVDFVSIVGEAAETVSHALDRDGFDVSLTLPDEPVWVSGDREQLMQVVRNLLENGLKYGGGRVEATLHLQEREPTMRGPAAILDVVDHGEGIEAHHVPRLTERFYRIDTHRSRTQGGTGLGLAIVKHVVGRHRGRLRISSVRGEGSVFTVLLPLLQSD